MEESTRNLLHWLNLWRMGAMWVAAILLSYSKLLLARLAGSERAFPRCLPDTDCRTLACIVTGASSGIGKATAEAIALKGYYVILAGRSMSRLCKVAEELQLRHRRITVKAMEVDLTSTASILKFTKAIEELLETPHGSMSLQLLINNAGILATTERKTPEGCECMIASNYLGHYMLTWLLLPLMQRSTQPARIVNVGSFTHRCVRGFDGLLSLLKKGEMQRPTNSKNNTPAYQIARIYEISKLFMIMFAYELHRRLNAGSSAVHITAMAADPGIVHTEILRELPSWFSSCVITCLRITRLMQSPSTGCIAVVDAALAPPRLSGKYFFGGCGRTITSSVLSYDQQLAANLWVLSGKLCSDAVPQHKLLL